MLNVDRIPAAPAASPSIAPAQSVAPAPRAADLVTTPAAGIDWMGWLRSYWWVLALLLLLVAMVYAQKHRSAATTRIGGGGMAKGSDEARARMAELRARKRKD